MLQILPPTFRRILRQMLPNTSPSISAEGSIRSMLLYQLGIARSLAMRLLEPSIPPQGWRYRHFQVPKRDGTQRELVEPGPRLKATQRRIGQILDRHPSHRAALGFRRGHSIADHAWAHAGAALIITADIEDFFGSTRRWRVAAWWRSQGYTDDETRLLTALTTYRGALPQGAPTSPPLSNILNHELDAALDRITRASGGTYTRYADDLAWSWPDDYAPPIGFERIVRAKLHEYGYTLNDRKGWCVWQRRDEPEITGLVLDRRGGVDVPDDLLRTMQTLARSKHPHDQRRLAGYTGYRSMIRRSGNRNPRL